MKKNILILVLFSALITVVVLNKSSKENAIQVPYPFTYDVSKNTSFACEALVSASVEGGQLSNLNGIKAESRIGTDKVALSIKDEKTLVFNTVASISAGITEGDEFIITHNDDKKLMAVWFNDKVISSVVLNKTNGLAVWLKGNPNFPIYENPMADAIYMICR